MRPRIFTLRNFALFTLACAIFGGMAYWLSQGAPLPGASVPSTTGKLVYISKRDGHSHLYMVDPAKPETEVALTSGTLDDEQPAFNRNGSEITFISSSGGSPQVYIVDARAGAKVRPLTRTSPAKSNPVFAGNDQRVYYLDSGKLSSTDPRDNDTDVVLPGTDFRTKIAPLFSTGGFERAMLSPNSKKILAVLHLERGSVLLIYDVEKQTLQLLGAGDKILFSYLPDSTFAVVYGKGAPFTEPQPIVDENAVHDPTFQIPPLQPFPESESTFLARYDAEGKPLGAFSIRFPPSAILAAPDGERLIIASDGSDKTTPGLLVLNFAKEGTDKQIYNKPASEPSLSPDGTQIAFVSGKNIYVIPAAGGNAVNLTKDRGENRTPLWSPAVKEK